MFADQETVAFAGDDSEPYGHLLHHIENRDQENLRQHHSVALLRSRLRGSDDRTRVGVGKHDDQAGSPERQSGKAEPESSLWPHYANGHRSDIVISLRNGVAIHRHVTALSTPDLTRRV